MRERLVWWLEDGTETCRFCGARYAYEVERRCTDCDRPMSAEEDLEARTKDEVHECARELEMPGRSGMTKDELADAIRSAS